MPFFTGKKIWIIGASTGIGRALVLELAKQGAILILSARDEVKLNTLNTEIGGNHLVAPIDVNDAAKINMLVRSLPSLDSVVYLAGEYEPRALDNLDLAICNSIVNTNLIGALNVIHAILPLMLRQQHGQIALCGSVAGYRGLPMAQPYGATKAALINLAESLRAEVGNRGIDVKIINPGFVRTPMTDKNKFHMPMIIETDKAAKALARGLQSRRFEISFPLRFTILMKVLNVLPYWLYFKLVKK